MADAPNYTGEREGQKQSKGAIFEILAVGYTTPNQVVTPAKASQRGYDLDIETKQHTKYRVSIKCYSESTHEDGFRKRAETARQKFVKGLKSTGLNALAFVEASRFPSEADWQLLYTSLSESAVNFNGSKTINQVKDIWLIGLLPLLPDEGEAFAANTVSHTFVCTARFHKNEQNNFLSKLESAISNLEKHVDPDSGHLPIILMRLPPTASAITLTNWSSVYLAENDSKVVGSIFFLQPYIASNEDGSSSHIAHYISAASSRKFATTPKDIIQLKIPVGLITTQPPTWQLRSDIGQKSLDEQYVYQHGEHFVAAQEIDGKIEGNIIRKAPGIESFLVLNLHGKSVTLSGRWGEELCLIGG